MRKGQDWASYITDIRIIWYRLFQAFVFSCGIDGKSVRKPSEVMVVTVKDGIA
jgi:hypothetical protein